MAALERDAYEGRKKAILFLPKLRELYFFFSSDTHCISSKRQKYDVGENDFRLMHQNILNCPNDGSCIHEKTREDS